MPRPAPFVPPDHISGMPHPSLNRLREICLALPDAHEVESWQAPTFRVKNKIFAMYSDPSDAQHSGGRPSVWLKAAPGNQGFLMDADPDRYFSPPYVGPSGWVGVRLDKRPRWKEIAEMVGEAYQLALPKRKRPTR
jgi:predicted DNA-binding protein (MmcQ/YjbR family)